MNIKAKSIASIRVIGLLLMINVCGQTRVKGEYYVGFVNKTEHLLDAVSVYYGGTQAAAAGGMVKGGMATDGPVTLPIPSEVEVKWIDASEPHAVKVKLDGVLPKRLTDVWTLYFIISSNSSVQAKAVRIDDRTAMKELEKGLRPEGEYRLGFVNKTGHDLEAVTAFYGDKKAGAGGNILSRVKVGYSDPLTLPIPPEVEIRWKEDGKDHTVKTKLEGIVPKKYAQGTVFFVIKEGDVVAVKPIKWNDEPGVTKLMK